MPLLEVNPVSQNSVMREGVPTVTLSQCTGYLSQHQILSLSDFGLSLQPSAISQRKRRSYCLPVGSSISPALSDQSSVLSSKSNISMHRHFSTRVL